MTDHASPDCAALIAEAERLLADITPGEDWNVEEDTEDLLDEYIGRVRREGCCCGTNDPADPWCEGHEPEQRVFHVEGPRKINIEDLGGYYTEADAKFIAAAPRLVRALLAVVREGEQEINRLRSESWNPASGVWLVENSVGIRSRRKIADLPEQADLAPFARHEDALAQVVLRRCQYGPCSPSDMARAITRWMRESTLASRASAPEGQPREEPEG